MLDTTVYVLYHGEYNKTHAKTLIGVYGSVEAATQGAQKIVDEDAASGYGAYGVGPGISYPADSGMLFRGLRENSYSLWVEKKQLIN
jgi:hypothetical protein